MPRRLKVLQREGRGGKRGGGIEEKKGRKRREREACGKSCGGGRGGQDLLSEGEGKGKDAICHPVSRKGGPSLEGKEDHLFRATINSNLFGNKERRGGPEVLGEGAREKGGGESTISFVLDLRGDARLLEE